VAKLCRPRCLLGALLQSGIALKLLLSANTSWYLWNFRASLIKRLLVEGYQIVIMAPPDSKMQDLTAMGCQCISFPVAGKGTNIFREFWLFAKYLYYLTSVKPDVYISFTIKPVLYGGLAARFLGIPTIVTITGLGTVFIRETFLTRLVERIYRYSLLKAERVLFQNQADRTEFVTRNLVNVEQTERVPGSGIDIRQFFYQPPRLRSVEEGMVFLMVARILKDKGIFEFVNAATRIKKMHPATRFILAGSADSDNQTAVSISQVELWHDTGVIEYVGFVENIIRLVGDADCVVLPSYREGLSRSLLEALAVGRPIVTTSVPGCADLVEDRVSGFICAPRNVDDLVMKIEQFIELNMQERENMGLAGRLRAEREFAEGIVLQQYSQIVDRIVKKTTQARK